MRSLDKICNRKSNHKGREEQTLLTQATDNDEWFIGVWGSKSL